MTDASLLSCRTEAASSTPMAATASILLKTSENNVGGHSVDELIDVKSSTTATTRGGVAMPTALLSVFNPARVTQGEDHPVAPSITLDGSATTAPHLVDCGERCEIQRRIQLLEAQQCVLLEQVRLLLEEREQQRQCDTKPEKMRATTPNGINNNNNSDVENLHTCRIYPWPFGEGETKQRATWSPASDQSSRAGATRQLPVSQGSVEALIPQGSHGASPSRIPAAAARAVPSTLSTNAQRKDVSTPNGGGLAGILSTPGGGSVGCNAIHNSVNNAVAEQPATPVWTHPHSLHPHLHAQHSFSNSSAMGGRGEGGGEANTVPVPSFTTRTPVGRQRQALFVTVVSPTRSAQSQSDDAAIEVVAAATTAFAASDEEKNEGGPRVGMPNTLMNTVVGSSSVSSSPTPVTPVEASALATVSDSDPLPRTPLLPRTLKASFPILTTSESSKYLPSTLSFKKNTNTAAAALAPEQQHSNNTTPLQTNRTDAAATAPLPNAGHHHQSSNHGQHAPRVSSAMPSSAPSFEPSDNSEISSSNVVAVAARTGRVHRSASQYCSAAAVLHEKERAMPPSYAAYNSVSNAHNDNSTAQGLSYSRERASFRKRRPEEEEDTLDALVWECAASTPSTTTTILPLLSHHNALALPKAKPATPLLSRGASLGEELDQQRGCGGGSNNKSSNSSAPSGYGRSSATEEREASQQRPCEPSPLKIVHRASDVTATMDQSKAIREIFQEVLTLGHRQSLIETKMEKFMKSMIEQRDKRRRFQRGTAGEIWKLKILCDRLKKRFTQQLRQQCSHTYRQRTTEDEEGEEEEEEDGVSSRPLVSLSSLSASRSRLGNSRWGNASSVSCGFSGCRISEEQQQALVQPCRKTNPPHGNVVPQPPRPPLQEHTAEREDVEVQKGSLHTPPTTAATSVDEKRTEDGAIATTTEIAGSSSSSVQSGQIDPAVATSLTFTVSRDGSARHSTNNKNNLRALEPFSYSFCDPPTSVINAKSDGRITLPSMFPLFEHFYSSPSTSSLPESSSTTFTVNNNNKSSTATERATLRTAEAATQGSTPTATTLSTSLISLQPPTVIGLCRHHLMPSMTLPGTTAAVAPAASFSTPLVTLSSSAFMDAQGPTAVHIAEFKKKGDEEMEEENGAKSRVPIASLSVTANSNTSNCDLADDVSASCVARRKNKGNTTEKRKRTGVATSSIKSRWREKNRSCRTSVNNINTKARSLSKKTSSSCTRSAAATAAVASSSSSLKRRRRLLSHKKPTVITNVALPSGASEAQSQQRRRQPPPPPPPSPPASMQLISAGGDEVSSVLLFPRSALTRRSSSSPAVVAGSAHSAAIASSRRLYEALRDSKLKTEATRSDGGGRRESPRTGVKPSPAMKAESGDPSVPVVLVNKQHNTSSSPPSSISASAWTSSSQSSMIALTSTNTSCTHQGDATSSASTLPALQIEFAPPPSSTRKQAATTVDSFKTALVKENITVTAVRPPHAPVATLHTQQQSHPINTAAASALALPTPSAHPCAARLASLATESPSLSRVTPIFLECSPETAAATSSFRTVFTATLHDETPILRRNVNTDVRRNNLSPKYHSILRPPPSTATSPQAAAAEAARKRSYRATRTSKSTLCSPTAASIAKTVSPAMVIDGHLQRHGCRTRSTICGDVTLHYNSNATHHNANRSRQGSVALSPVTAPKAKMLKSGDHASAVDDEHNNNNIRHCGDTGISAIAATVPLKASEEEAQQQQANKTEVAVEDVPTGAATPPTDVSSTAASGNSSGSSEEGNATYAHDTARIVTSATTAIPHSPLLKTPLCSSPSTSGDRRRRRAPPPLLSVAALSDEPLSLLCPAGHQHDVPAIAVEDGEMKGNDKVKDKDETTTTPAFTHENMRSETKEMVIVESNDDANDDVRCGQQPYKQQPLLFAVNHNSHRNYLTNSGESSSSGSVYGESCTNTSALPQEEEENQERGHQHPKPPCPCPSRSQLHSAIPGNNRSCSAHGTSVSPSYLSECALEGESEQEGSWPAPQDARSSKCHLPSPLEHVATTLAVHDGGPIVTVVENTKDEDKDGDDVQHHRNHHKKEIHKDQEKEVGKANLGGSTPANTPSFLFHAAMPVSFLSPTSMQRRMMRHPQQQDQIPEQQSHRPPQQLRKPQRPQRRRELRRTSSSCQMMHASPLSAPLLQQASNTDLQLPQTASSFSLPKTYGSVNESASY